VREKTADVRVMMVTELADLLRSAVPEVFSTMLSMEAEYQPPDAPKPEFEAQVAGAVGFTGKLDGVVYLFARPTFAHLLTSRLLGLDESEIDGDEMVNDAVGELTNRGVGHMKSRLCDRGAACVITIPSVVRGSHFSITPVSPTEAQVLHFRCQNDHLLVQVMIKP
jgi:chemotaxis protein CheX